MSRRALLAAPLALGVAQVASAGPQPEPLLALFEEWRAVQSAIAATLPENIDVNAGHPLEVEGSALEAAMLETPPRSAAGLAALARVHVAIWGPACLDGSDADHLEHRFMRAILEGAEALAAREGQAHRRGRAMRSPHLLQEIKCGSNIKSANNKVTEQQAADQKIPDPAHLPRCLSRIIRYLNYHPITLFTAHFSHFWCFTGIVFKKLREPFHPQPLEPDSGIREA